LIACAVLASHGGSSGARSARTSERARAPASWHPADLLGRERQRRARRRQRRRQCLAVGVLSIVAEAGVLWVRAGRPGGNVVVRCRSGHLYTTIWIPGISAKALRLGWWRVQRCPVGHHWSLVTPVRESELTEDERRLARGQRDLRIP
jgi:hypothetical protein